jgi:hypothetical protein
MLLLAYLISKSQDWEESPIRVLAYASGPQQEELEETLHSTLADARIQAQIKILDPDGNQSLGEEAASADLVLLPFRMKENRFYDPMGEPLEKLLPSLPLTALVRAAKDIDLEAEPEDGAAGETAAALDELATAEKRLQKMQKRAQAADAEVEKALKKVQDFSPSQSEEERMTRIKAVLEAKEQAGRAARRLAKALAKAEDAAQAAEALGVDPAASGAKKEKPDNP